MSTNSLVKTSSLSVVLAIFVLLTQAQPVANFSATPLSGCAPLVVNFTDQSTGNPTQWRWDLGNGTISFLQNPSVTYFNPGQYSIKLVAQNASGADSIIKTQYITIFAQPVVNFSGSPLSGCFPLPVQFTDMSTPGNGTIFQWEWDFGDGNTSTLQNPSHIYTAGGNYNVSLRITNSNGCFKTLTRLQYIKISNGVTANFSNTVPVSCSPPVIINFQNLSSGTGTLNYLWDFGDGNTSTAANPSHTYNNTGSYTVQLIVTSSLGCADTLTKINAITIGAVDANFTIPVTACVNTPFSITNTSIPAPVSALWNFGDGTSSNVLNPTKFYNTPGVYQVKLISNFGACTDSITKSITILPKPNSVFTGNPLSGCKQTLTVNFTNNSTNAVSTSWDFGDGNTSSQTNPSHTYTNTGTYTVTLISTNSFGCNDTLVRQNFINIAYPQATINNLPAQGCAPLSITFSSTVISNDPVTSYFWDLGDGTTSTSANPTHVFPAGVYDIKLIITTANGCTDTVIVPAGVKAGIKPVANFNASPLNVCAMVPVNFFDLSTGVIDQWEWDFGDGGTSTLQNPIHVYEDTGFFDIQLIVSNNGCSDTFKLLNYIHIDPPIAIFKMDLDCIQTNKRVFTDQSIGADTWSWDFGDGTISTVQNPVHIYTTPGLYVVTLTVTNIQSGCSYSTSKQTLVMLEQAGFNSPDTVICRNTTASFTATTSSVNITSYEWNFGDGGTATGNSTSHVYTTAGIYDVSLIITDLNGCKDTLIKPQYIHVNGPTANFGVLSSGTCSMNIVPLTDSSVTDGTHPINTWIWNYGDGIIDTLQSGPFQHTYAAGGNYTLSLKIRDSEGCVDSIVKFSLLTISQPAAEFSTADTVSCPGRTVTFTNASTGPNLQYKWDFGDGNTSAANNPVHIYTSDGVYTVTLSITDQYGCNDTLTRINYVRLATPKALFTVSDSLGTCPPLVVNFTNNSVNYTTHNWDFGDGTSSQAVNPSHFYSAPGTYIATLTVNGPVGCTSVKTQTILVRGPLGSFTYGPLTGCNTLTVNFVATTRDRVSFIWDFNDGNTISTTDSLITHTYTIPGYYLPKMILIDAGGCVVPITGIDTIKVHGADASFGFNSQTLCNSGNVQFSNTTLSNDGILSYNWDFGDGTTSNVANPVHFYSSPGLYYPKLTVTTLSGCKDSMTSIAPVKIVTIPQGLISQTPDGCAPLNVLFNGTATADTSALTWKWKFGNGDSSLLKDPPAEMYTTSGLYAVSLFVTNSSGCIDTVSSSINAFLVPTINAGSDTLICMGTSTKLKAAGALTYEWDAIPGLSCYTCADPVATPDSITKYIVTGTTAQGCKNKDSIIVSIKYPFAMLDSGNDTLCIGKSAKLLASGASTYVWSPSAGLNNINIANPVASPAQTTIYQVIGTDEKGCFRDTAFVPVFVYPIPGVEAGQDVTINVGQMIDLIPVLSADVTNVTWSPTGSIFRNNYPSITVKPKETTTYRIEVINEGGCLSTDNLTVRVICNGANVFIPNTFSPNGDGANDIFYPRGTGLFSVKTAKIFNRWGEIVYERNNFQSNDVTAGWDGTFKGVKLNPDVYVYLIEILCDNNTTLPFKGNVALIR
ncbi:MAG: PKD domain-containing protein [Ferruginibacter sp.]